MAYFLNIKCFLKFKNVKNYIKKFNFEYTILFFFDVFQKYLNIANKKLPRY